jgi:hypothetical protein
MEGTMKLWIGSILTMACVSLGRPALADDDHASLRWREIIGIIQAGNVVGGIPGGGQPWSTLGGHASVDLDSGRVAFRVDGLVLAGGNAIGTPDAITTVKGTLVCDPGGADQAVVDTPLVPLSALGDAEFHGNVGPLPAVCSTAANVAFLIRIPANRWIANGAVLHRHAD